MDLNILNHCHCGMDVDKNKLEEILTKGSEQSEYTIREKVAQVVRISGEFSSLREKLQFDDNYYVRNLF